MHNEFVHQHVDFSTRDNNVLYLAFTGEVHIVQSTGRIGKLGRCDHDLIEFQRHTKTTVKTSKQEIPVFEKQNLTKLRQIFEKCKVVEE